MIFKFQSFGSGVSYIPGRSGPFVIRAGAYDGALEDV